VSKAITWNKRQPEALYRQAVALRNNDPDTAATLLAQANTHHMADARPFFAAAQAALTQGNPAHADTLDRAGHIVEASGSAHPVATTRLLASPE